MNKQKKRNIFAYKKYFLISIFCVLLILLLKTASQTIPAKDNFHIYNDKLISIYSAYQENLLKTRTPLKIKKDNDSIVVINNCVEYIEQLKYFPDCKSIINKRINSEYQTCLQLATLKHSISPKQSLWKQDSLTSFIYKYLDLSTFRSSLRPKWGKKGSFYLENFEFDSVIIEPFTITINTKKWLYIFDILAAGDINHDGYEDVLISFLDDAKEGTYFSFSTFLLIFRYEGDKKLIAIKIENILK